MIPKTLRVNLKIEGDWFDFVTWPLDTLARYIAVAKKNRAYWKRKSKLKSRDLHLDAEGQASIYTWLYYGLLVVWYCYYKILLGIFTVVGWFRSLI